ncbi:MAG TPA: tetratricopeptide repeat protein [Syntrophales bacterium]|nr:tetratricopeptide repeat protein [Syntrophales bacterium]HOM07424.1 tetratricopeptide repeat protein [Syntrophales bacterium]HON99996.1 tetratricopeptide repeat protein [Syntrophales bacterium]HPC01516.1 tetratricopeptide repeat protein [Syntrophales bacterium]HPQ07065.1 tetratricopeptide repeat protein [Syntrophales bacterium]
MTDPWKLSDTTDSYEPIRPRGVSLRLAPLILFFLAVLLVVGLYHLLRTSGPFRMVEEVLRADGAVAAAVGGVQECLPWYPLSGRLTKEGVEVEMTVRVRGRMAEGLARARIRYEGEVWRLTALSFTDPRGVSRELLREERKGAVSRDTPGYGDLMAGHRLFRSGDYAGAVEAYSRAIGANPSFEAAYYWRARAYVKANQSRAAMEDFEKVVEINPRNVDAHNWLGWLAGREGRYDECIAYLNRSLELRPDSAWSRYERGRCHYEKGDRASALADAAKACELGNKEACRIAERLRK